MDAFVSKSFVLCGFILTLLIPVYSEYLMRWNVGYPKPITSESNNIVNNYSPYSAIIGFNDNENCAYIFTGEGYSNPISTYRFNMTNGHYKWEQRNTNKNNIQGFPVYGYSRSQSYTTVNNVIFYYWSGNIYRYSMIYPYTGLTALSNTPTTNSFACLTSDDRGYLYLTRGHGSKIVYTYTSINGWKTFEYPLFYPRYYESCEVVNQTLYIIGSSSNIDASKWIEYIDISEHNKLYPYKLPSKFKILRNPLYPGVYYHRTTVVNHLIYIAGGYAMEAHGMYCIV